MYMFRHRGERLQAGMGNSMRKFPLLSLGLELIGKDICIMIQRFGPI
jgi:hypothetical protein